MKAYYVTCLYEGKRCFLAMQTYREREWFAGPESIPRLMYEHEVYLFRKMAEQPDKVKEISTEWYEEGYTDFKVHEIELKLD